jgi:hypothetical protein
LSGEPPQRLRRCISVTKKRWAESPILGVNGVLGCESDRTGKNVPGVNGSVFFPVRSSLPTHELNGERAIDVRKALATRSSQDVGAQNLLLTSC